MGAVTLALPVGPLLGTSEAHPAFSPDDAGAVASTKSLAAPTVSPRHPIAHERFAVSGRLGGHGRRQVVLQRRTSDGWVKVRRSTSTEDGHYRLHYATGRRAVVLRVSVARTGRPGHRASARTTVRTVTDRTRLAISGSTESALAVATSAPPRRGRKVTLEVRNGDTWRAAAGARRQDAAGRARFSLHGLSPASQRFRVRVGSWHGAPSFVGGRTVFTPSARGWAVPAAPQPLSIDTAGGVDIVSKDEYVPASMTLAGQAYDLQIKGRGNSTWGWEKKPYRIKLATAASLLDMPVERDWVLLANWADRSGLRNHLALTFGAQKTSLAWTPRDRYVDVVLNGRPIGLYQLTEQVEQSESRVALPAGGMLLEVDRKAAENGDPYFLSPHNVPITYNDPDDPTPDEQAAVQAAVADLETALYGEDFADPEHGYAAHMDLDSFVDWYLLNEFFANHDSRFNSSVMITWVPGGTFTMGPPWDFDLSAGSGWLPNSPIPPDTWWTRGGHENWYTRLVQDPAFEARIEARWATLRPAFQQLVDQVPAAADALSDAAQRDWNLWHEDDTHDDVGQIHADTLAGEVEYVHDWMTARLAWLDSQLGSD